MKNPTYTIISPYTFINFPWKIQPTGLIGPTRLFGTLEYEIGKKEESSNMSDPSKQPPPYPTQAGAGGFVAPPPYPPQPSGYKPPEQSQPGFGYSNQQVWILFTSYIFFLVFYLIHTYTYWSTSKSMLGVHATPCLLWWNNPSHF